MDIVSQILEQSHQDAEKYPNIFVHKSLDLEIDIGSLLAYDKNELDSSVDLVIDIKDKQVNHSETVSKKKRKRVEDESDELDESSREVKRNKYVLDITRDNVQLLLNRVWELPTERCEEAIVVKLPKSTTILPRTKPVPKPRPLTKWQEFAKAKGIQKKKKAKLSWDEELKKWVPLYGFKRAAHQKEKDWVIEVPQNADPLEDQFAKKKAAKVERVSKNELQRLRNIAKARNIKVPKVGLPNPDVASAKELQAAITVARSSTASLGKFQNKLPKEKDARGISNLLPAGNRKRKMPPLSSEQERKTTLDIIDSVLNKKPRLNVEKAVTKHINSNEPRLEEGNNKKGKKGGKKSKGSNPKGGKKPSSGKGQRKGKIGGGRKRR